MDAWTRRRRDILSTKGCAGSRTTPRCGWRWDLEGAAAAYRQAAVTAPGSQTANLALSHVLDQLGDRDTALEALGKTLTRDRAEAIPDGWWRYLYGQAQDADALIEDLRQQASQ
jgi:tetratricopeptide (TPR) repeat protein